MTFSSKIRTLLRGDVRLMDLPRETFRRKKAASHQDQERRNLEKIANAPVRLAPRFRSLSSGELLSHFRKRDVCFFPTKNVEDIANLLSEHFPTDKERLIAEANQIANEARWELAGLGPFAFGGENFWRRDPITGKDWGLDYHADVVTYQEDGADIRILWELNRFGHGVTLACAYCVTGNETYAATFFTHIGSWMQQNPYGRGANWNCAMEVALRSINLLAAFDLLRSSAALNEERLSLILKLFDQHGRFILENNEFSYISTSNHYLSDVIGLFWIGTLMPELEHAAKWKEFGLREMFREIDKQIQPDGTDFEASTGYHKFVTEMVLYSFVLARRTGVEIQQKYTEKLHRMLLYLRNILRPDGRMPLIGDADGSQIVPIVKHDADDSAYLLSAGSVLLNDEKLEVSRTDPGAQWLLGQPRRPTQKQDDDPRSSQFNDAGAYVLRDGDLYLHFNANGCGLNGRGSHGHNDALSIEISAFGRPFIIDPGSYVYNFDREERHHFRSTAYHSTLMVDDQEQNTTDADSPFVMGNEARPVVDVWETSVERDCVSGQHFGYTRLRNPITHRRTVEFNKTGRQWLIEDLLTGKGTHKFSFSFHLAPGIGVKEVNRSTIGISDNGDNTMYIQASGIDAAYKVVPAFASRNYGHREPSSILQWEITATAPFTTSFLIRAVSIG
jgi:hypothetical protein